MTNKDTSKPPLTVAELIELLKKQPQDAPVTTEGCDCYGDAGDVVLKGEHEDQWVLITRQ